MKKLVHLFLYTLTFLSLNRAQAQNLNLEWLAESNNSFSQNTSMTSDTNGNIFIAGTFSGTISMDVSNPADTFTTADGTTSSFIKKYDKNGNYLGSMAFATDDYVAITNITCDKDNNLIVNGDFRTNIDDNNQLITSPPTSSLDVFIYKLNNDLSGIWGNHIVGKSADGSKISIDRSVDLDVDQEGFIYLLMQIGKQYFEIDNAGTFLTSGYPFASSSGGYVVLRLNPSGNYDDFWGTNIEYRALHVDDVNNFYLWGYNNREEVWFGQNEIFDATPQFNHFIIKYEDKLPHKWGRMSGGQLVSTVHGLSKIDTTLVAVANTYRSFNTAETFNTRHASLLSFSSNSLKIVDEKSFGSDGYDNFVNDLIISDSTIILCGKYKDILTENGNDILVSNGGVDQYILGFDRNGNEKFAASLGSSESSGDSYSPLLASDESGFAIAANISKSADFDFGNGVANLSNSNAFNPAYLAKYELGNSSTNTFIVDLGNDAVVCPGSSITLDGSINQAEGITYIWNTGSTTPVIVVSSAGIYSVSVFQNGNLVGSDTIEITFSEPLDLIPFQDTIVNESIEIVIPYNGTYTWSTGSNQQSIEIETTGAYTVTYISPENCVYKDSVFVEVNVVNSIFGNASKSVQVYPNPVVDILTIDVAHSNEHYTYNLFDTKGGIISSGTLQNNTLSIGAIPAGIYLLQLQSGDEFYHQKIYKVSNN